MKKVNSLLFLCFIFILTNVVIAKPFKKGAIKVNFYLNHSDINSISVNDNDENNYQKKALDDIVMADFEYFQNIDESISNLDSNLNSIDLDTKIFDSWKQSDLHLELQYDLSDTLHLNFSTGYKKSTLTYTQAFQEQSELIDIALTAKYALEGLDKVYYRVPNQAFSDALTDSFIGLTYLLSDKTTLSIQHSSGILKTGRTAKDIKLSDNYQELATSHDADTSIVTVKHKVIRGEYPIQLALTYTRFSEGLDHFLENHYVKTKMGDIIVLSTNTSLMIHERLQVQPDLIIAYYQKDKVNELIDDSYTTWQNIDGSEGFLIKTALQLNYKNNSEIQPFLKASYIVKNTVNSSIYESTGRLKSDYSLRFGIEYQVK